MNYAGSFYFNPDDPIYQDHFPGQPVVPGSLIVQAFITAAGQIPEAAKAQAVKNFRFKRFITPGTYAYRLELTETSSTGLALHCSLFDGERLVVSGVLQ